MLSIHLPSSSAKGKKTSFIEDLLAQTHINTSQQIQSKQTRRIQCTTQQQQERKQRVDVRAHDRSDGVLVDVLDVEFND